MNASMSLDRQTVTAGLSLIGCGALPVLTQSHQQDLETGTRSITWGKRSSFTTVSDGVADVFVMRGFGVGIAASNGGLAAISLYRLM
jgi:hypothetical protein